MKDSLTNGELKSKSKLNSIRLVEFVFLCLLIVVTTAKRALSYRQ